MWEVSEEEGRGTAKYYDNSEILKILGFCFLRHTHHGVYDSVSDGISGVQLMFRPIITIKVFQEKSLQTNFERLSSNPNFEKR